MDDEQPEPEKEVMDMTAPEALDLINEISEVVGAAEGPWVAIVPAEILKPPRDVRGPKGAVNEARRRARRRANKRARIARRRNR